MTIEEQLPDGQIVCKERLPDPEPGMALYLVTYMSQGLKVKGFLVIPENRVPCPGFLYCRGGIRRVGMVRLERIVPFAKRGYVVFAPFYRGNEGGEGREDFGGEDRYDVIHALPVLRSLPEVTRDPIVLMGFSRGAIMAMGTAVACEGIGPVVIRGGVSDLLLTYEERIDLRRMLKRVVGHPVKQKEEYWKRSPVYMVENLRSPVLIVHGSEDRQVGVEHAYRLANALKQANKPYTLRIYEGLGHQFPPEQDEEAMDFIFAWIREKMDGNGADVADRYRT